MVLLMSTKEHWRQTKGQGATNLDNHDNDDITHMAAGHRSHVVQHL